jgi:cytidylate kinase
VKNVITISRQKGSGGRTIAEIIARRLDWQLVRREMVSQAAKKAGVDDTKIESAFEHRPTLQDRITLQQRFSKYLGVLSDVIHEYANQGNVVLLGRGAHIILADDPRLFRVHLVADLEARIERIAAQCRLRGKKGLEEARRMVIDSDYARAAYHTYVYDAEWNDPLNFELVLNTTELTMEQAAEGILAVFEVCRR